MTELAIDVRARPAYGTKTHLLPVVVKLGVDDRTRAVTVAMARGPRPRPR